MDPMIARFLRWARTGKLTRYLLLAGVVAVVLILLAGGKLAFVLAGLLART